MTPPGGFTATRKIGDAAVTIISEGSMSWAPKFVAPEAEWRRAVPEVGADGAITIGLNLAHIRIGNASILIDPGLDDPDSAWQRRFAARWPGVRRSPGLERALEALGVRAGEVTHVLITHAHGDHFGGVTVEREGRDAARFPRARHLIGRADWARNPAREDRGSDLAVRLGIVEGLGLLDLVDDEREIVPGVTMIPAPGETPGHSIVRVRSAGETFYYVGDLFHLPCEVEHHDWVPAGRDQAAMRASRGRLVADAVPERATLVFTHEQFPAWGRIARERGGTRWERAW